MQHLAHRLSPVRRPLYAGGSSSPSTKSRHLPALVKSYPPTAGERFPHRVFGGVLRGRADLCRGGSFLQGLFPDVPAHKALASGASAVSGGVGRVHQEGRSLSSLDASTFAPVQLVIQRVTPSSFFIEAPMLQTELALLGRLDAPSVVPPHLIARCKSYREAVQLCWELRRVKEMTKRMLAERTGLYASHVTCYFSERSKTKRNLPGEYVKPVEWALGNTAISQWHVLNAQLTCVEEMQAQRLVAA